MAIAVACLETGAVTGMQEHLTAVSDQHDLTFEHVDELVLMGVPMSLARRVAGGKG